MIKMTGLALASAASLALLVSSTPFCAPSRECFALLLQRQIVAIASAGSVEQSSGVRPPALVVDRAEPPAPQRRPASKRNTLSESPAARKLRGTVPTLEESVVPAAVTPVAAVPAAGTLDSHLAATACPKTAAGQPS